MRRNLLANRQRDLQGKSSTMGGGNAQKSATARARNLEKAKKANKGAWRALAGDGLNGLPSLFLQLQLLACAIHRRQPIEAKRGGAEHQVLHLPANLHLHHHRGKAERASGEQASQG